MDRSKALMKNVSSNLNKNPLYTHLNSYRAHLSHSLNAHSDNYHLITDSSIDEYIVYMNDIGLYLL